MFFVFSVLYGQREINKSESTKASKLNSSATINTTCLKPPPISTVCKCIPS